MSVFSRTGKKLRADYHRLAEWAWDITLHYARAEAHRHAAAELVSSATMEILSTSIDTALREGKPVSQKVAIEGIFLFSPIHYEEVKMEFEPKMQALRDICERKSASVDLHPKDGEFMGPRPLTLSLDFRPQGYRL